jgi:hypothetical protein
MITIGFKDIILSYLQAYGYTESEIRLEFEHALENAIYENLAPEHYDGTNQGELNLNG